MKAFFTAFRTYSVSTQFYTDVGGQLYTDEAPQNTDYPYAVWTFPYGFPEYDLVAKKSEGVTAQLDIYADNTSEILSLFDEADNSFNNCSFTVAGYSLTRFRRVSQRLIKEDGISRYIIEFSIEIGEE